MPTPSGNALHDAAVLAAEAQHQTAIAAIVASGKATTIIVNGPTGPTPVLSPALANRAAEIAAARALLSSALTNGGNPAPYLTMLRELGQSVYP